jgi:hypothetical protein
MQDINTVEDCHNGNFLLVMDEKDIDTLDKHFKENYFFYFVDVSEVDSHRHKGYMKVYGGNKLFLDSPVYYVGEF